MQKIRKTWIFSGFFMTRKEVKSYSKEWPHLTKKKQKKDCLMLKHREQSFLVKLGRSLEKLLTPFLVMKKCEKIPVLLFFCPLFIYVIKFWRECCLLNKKYWLYVFDWRAFQYLRASFIYVMSNKQRKTKFALWQLVDFSCAFTPHPSIHIHSPLINYTDWGRIGVKYFFNNLSFKFGIKQTETTKSLVVIEDKFF
jgi:hypothetical protein